MQRERHLAGLAIITKSLLDAPAEATDQENPEDSEKDSGSSSEEEANKIVIESKNCTEDDALNSSITLAASNDSSSSSSKGDLLPIFQSTMRRSVVPDGLPAKTNEATNQFQSRGQMQVPQGMECD